jgi:putative transposase
MDWPHAPIHRFTAGTFFVTAGTYQKQHFFRSPLALDSLQASLFECAATEQCALQSWCLLSNHYHLVGQVNNGEDLRRFLRRFHSVSAKARNRSDEAPGRQVWFQFRETELTYERSWLARLRYTHENAVHHGIVDRATNYRWCSAAWFETNARPAFVATLRGIRMDLVKVRDDFEGEAAPLPCESGGRAAALH